MNPEQDLFTSILIKLKDKKYNVYDLFIPKEPLYPLVLIGASITSDTIFKNGIGGKISLTLHFYHNNLYERGIITKLIDDVRGNVREIKGSSFNFRNINATQRMLIDSSDNGLYHGVLDLEYIFS